MAELTHIPVMMQEVLETLSPKDGEIYLDGTFGGGGYTRAILTQANCNVIGIDRDPYAIEKAKTLQAENPEHFQYAHARFSEFPDVLDNLGVDKIDGFVLDLGVSSYQIDDPERGFSFRFDAPLTMTMGRNNLTAYDVINTYSEQEIATILRQGEEYAARRIARKIVEKRAESPIETTGQLAALVSSCKPPSKDGQNTATVTFQALRIFVNEELIELEKALEFCKNRLKIGGRLVVVTFHSLEDRIVKEFMRRESGNTPLPSRHMPLMEEHRITPAFTLLQKKPLLPSHSEMYKNPRSRSAKLRYAIRTGKELIDLGGEHYV